jgi:hypothetical protein
MWITFIKSLVSNESDWCITKKSNTSISSSQRYFSTLSGILFFFCITSYSMFSSDISYDVENTCWQQLYYKNVLDTANVNRTFTLALLAKGNVSRVWLSAYEKFGFRFSLMMQCKWNLMICCTSCFIKRRVKW